MKIATIDARRSRVVAKNMTAVNFRNMMLIQHEFDAVGMYDVFDVHKNLNNKFDVFICGFGSASNDFKITKQLFDNNPDAKIFWICGEYEQNSYWAIIAAKREFEVIKNFEGSGKIAHYRDLCKRDHFVNLNLLIAKQPNPLTEKKFGCLYYGRWRPGRSKYFKTYLNNDIFLSTSVKNMKKYKDAGCDPKYIDTISWTPGRETLNLFKYSLYIEDEHTHTVFNCLANRWYESGFCNNVVFFDVNCWNTIRKSEIAQFENQIADYVVSDAASLKRAIEYCDRDFEKHLAIQKSWRTGEMLLRENVVNEIKSIVYGNK